MPAYIVAEIEVTNVAGYEAYRPLAGASIAQHGGKFLVRGGKTVATQGVAPAPRVVVIQFESLDKAQAWWDSPAQKAAQAIGDKYATFRSFLVEGLAQ